MQVEVDEICMCIKFGLLTFSFAPFHFPSNLAKFSFRTMYYNPWGQKIESAQKITVHILL